MNHSYGVTAPGGRGLVAEPQPRPVGTGNVRFGFAAPDPAGQQGQNRVTTDTPEAPHAWGSPGLRPSHCAVECFMGARMIREPIGIVGPRACGAGCAAPSWTDTKILGSAELWSPQLSFSWTVVWSKKVET